MRVAVQNTFPNYPVVAETELIRRILIAAGNLGWEAVEVVTSDDILRFRPDCVLATHFASPKLTPHITIGTMFNPPEYFLTKRAWLRNVLSYDAYLTGSPLISEFLEDFLFSTGKKLPISDFSFLPTSHRTDFVKRAPGPCHLFFVGTRWSTDRHGALMERLSRAVSFHIYGPASRWAGVDCNYRGEIPSDGHSVFDRIREAGVALCVHSQEHRAWNVPSMRVFEAAAAGAVIITDEMPLFDCFGENILRIDLSRPEAAVVDQVAAHMAWIDTHPAQAEDMARRAHAIFRERFCLERLLEQLPAFVERAGHVSGSLLKPSTVTPATVVDFVVPAGARPTADVKRCLQSLRAQSCPGIGVILVQSGEAGRLDALAEQYRTDFAALKVVDVPHTEIRSRLLWAGLREVTAPFFAQLDCDHTLHPNHVASLLDRLSDDGSAGFAYSGTIEAHAEDGRFFHQDNHGGPLGRSIRETRRLAALEEADLQQLEFDPGTIGACAWIARRELLDPVVLRDPNLLAAEEVCLAVLLRAKTKFVFSWRPTCERILTATARSAHAEAARLRSLARIRLRIRLPYPPEQAVFGERPQLFADCGTPSERHILKRVAQALLAARAICQFALRPQCWPRRVYRGLRTLLRRGPRRFLSRLASLGRD